jgi:hypothetical protein
MKRLFNILFFVWEGSLSRSDTFVLSITLGEWDLHWAPGSQHFPSHLSPGIRGTPYLLIHPHLSHPLTWPSPSLRPPSVIASSSFPLPLTFPHGPRGPFLGGSGWQVCPPGSTTHLGLRFQFQVHSYFPFYFRFKLSLIGHESWRK